MHGSTPTQDHRQMRLALIGFPLVCIAGLAIVFWDSKPQPAAVDADESMPLAEQLTLAPVNFPVAAKAPPRVPQSGPTIVTLSAPAGFSPANAPIVSTHDAPSTANGFHSHALPARSSQADLAALSDEQAALLAEHDELQTAIIHGDLPAIAAWIDSGRGFEFNFNDIRRGRTGESPLTIAVYRERLDVVRLLLDAGVDINRRDEDGNAAAHKARSMEMLRLLAEHGADLNLPDSNGRAPLASAATDGDLEKIEWLLALGANPDQATQTDLLEVAYDFRHPELIAPLLSRGVKPRSPWLLFQAIEDGNSDMVRLLVRGGADVNAPHERSWPLYQALYRQRWDSVGVLLDAGANVDIPDKATCERRLPECHSASLAKLASFDAATLRRLKAAGLDVDSPDNKEGHTALISLILEQPMALVGIGSPGPAKMTFSPPDASGVGTVVVTKGLASMPARETTIPAPDNAVRIAALLAAGADPNRKFQGKTPLMLAVEKFAFERERFAADAARMTQVLIDNGARIDYEGSIDLRSAMEPHYDPSQSIEYGLSAGPLTWALNLGASDVALRLVERDKRVEPADRDLVYFAAAREEWDLLMAALPYARAYVDARNRGGVTALMMAAERGRADAVQALLQAGADVDARSKQRWSPSLARTIVAGLVGDAADHGTPARLVGGYTALRAATEAGHAQAARVLREAGAKEWVEIGTMEQADE